MTTLETVLKMISPNPYDLPECHSLSPKRERCRKPDGHESEWHIGCRTRWRASEEHSDSPTSPRVEKEPS